MPITEFARPVVYGKRGMICSNSPLATTAGLKVLQQGGNAFDAALAVAAVEAVTLVPLAVIVIVLGVYPHAVLDLLNVSLVGLNEIVASATPNVAMLDVVP